MSFKIKRLTIGDEKVVINLVKKFKSAFIRPDHAENFLEDEANIFIAAVKDDVPIGFLLAYELSRIDRQQNMMFFYEIEVSQNYRRKGIGKALIEHLKEICKKRRICKMFVMTNKSNLPAMGLYSSTGGKTHSDDEIMFTYK